MSTSREPLLFADLLRRYRQAAGLTQAELAEAARLGLRGVSDLERGVRSTPRLETVQRLTSALRLTESEAAAFLAAGRRQRQRPHAVPPVNLATGAPSPTPLAPSSVPPLVGRVRELEQIERLLAGGVGSGLPPQLLLLAGEPGIGKTRLLHEASVRASARGWCVIAGGCTRRSGQEAYAPLVGALACFLDARTPIQQRHDLAGCAWLVRLLPELAERAVVPTLGWTLVPEQERRLMFAAVGRFLANIAGAAGTLLLLDDLQWAGVDALDLVATLARTQGERPVRVIGAYRSTDVRAGTALADLLADLGREGLAARLTLAALRAQEAAALLAQLTRMQGNAWSDERCQQVAQRAGGVPYFLVSCVQSLGARPSVPDSPDTTDGQKDDQDGEDMNDAPPIPWNVAETILQRVAHLPERAQHLLRLAAVVGREVEAELLLALAADWGWPKLETLAELEVASQARLLVALKSAQGGTALGRPGYGFAHDLVREVVLSDLSEARRANLHLQVAEALERLSRLTDPKRELRAAELAWHYLEAGAPGQALPYALHAGERAEAVYAYIEAEQHFRTALTVVQEREDWARAAEIHRRLGAILTKMAQYDGAVEELKHAMENSRSIGNFESMVRSAAQLGQVHALRGAPGEGIALLLPLVAEIDAKQVSAASSAALSTTLAALFSTCDRYHEQLAAGQRAVILAGQTGDDHLLAQAETRRATALVFIEPLDEAARALEEVIPLLERAEQVRDLSFVLHHLGMACWGRAEFRQDWQHCTNALELATRIDDPVQTTFMTFRLGVPAYYMGEWPLARRQFERAVTLARGHSRSFALPYTLWGLGQLCLAEGHWDVAERYLNEASAQNIDSKPVRLAQGALAERDLLRGEPEAACARLELFLPSIQQQGSVDLIESLPLFTLLWMPLLAWAYLERGDLQRAEAATEATISRARACNVQVALADALRIRALTYIWRYRWAEASATLDELLGLCRRLSYPYAEAKALFVYGLLHLRKDEPMQAQERFTDALAICKRLGERLYAERIAVEFVG